MSTNLTVLIGRMTKDVDVKTSGKGDKIANFTLAVNRGFQSNDGVTADFIPCVVFGKTAENVEKYCAKGSQVAVQGSIRTRSYENKEGNKVNVTEIICSSVEFLGSKQDAQPKAKKEDFFNVKPMNLEKEFDSAFDSFDVMEDNIQF